MEQITRSNLISFGFTNYLNYKTYKGVNCTIDTDDINKMLGTKKVAKLTNASKPTLFDMYDEEGSVVNKARFFRTFELLQAIILTGDDALIEEICKDTCDKKRATTFILNFENNGKVYTYGIEFLNNAILAEIFFANEEKELIIFEKNKGRLNAIRELENLNTILNTGLKKSLLYYLKDSKNEHIQAILNLIKGVETYYVIPDNPFDNKWDTPFMKEAMNCNVEVLELANKLLKAFYQDKYLIKYKNFDFEETKNNTYKMTFKELDLILMKDNEDLPFDVLTTSTRRMVDLILVIACFTLSNKSILFIDNLDEALDEVSYQRLVNTLELNRNNKQYIITTKKDS